MVKETYQTAPARIDPRAELVDVGAAGSPELLEELLRLQALRVEALSRQATEQSGSFSRRHVTTRALPGFTSGQRCFTSSAQGLSARAAPDRPVRRPYRRYPAAVVTATMRWGSSGRLRKEFKMPPPGDLRNCMVALSEEEDVLAKLFAYRFRAGDGLEGHSFGNLFVAALTEITGDFGHAIQLASKILATRGRIYPVTTANATLVARMDDGSLVRGETKITASRKRIAELMLDSFGCGSSAGDAVPG